MKKKLFLNVFYNLCIMVSIVGAVSAYKNNSPLISIFLAAVIAAFVYFKIKLRNELRKEFMQGPPPPKK